MDLTIDHAIDGSVKEPMFLCCHFDSLCLLVVIK